MCIHDSPSWKPIWMEQYIMSKQLDTAIEALVTTYSSLDSVAQGLFVDAKEVADALASATPDTAEYVALTVLAKYNPYTAPAPKPKTITTE